METARALREPFFLCLKLSRRNRYEYCCICHLFAFGEIRNGGVNGIDTHSVETGFITSQGIYPDCKR